MSHQVVIGPVVDKVQGLVHLMCSEPVSEVEPDFLSASRSLPPPLYTPLPLALFCNLRGDSPSPHVLGGDEASGRLPHRRGDMDAAILASESDSVPSKRARDPRRHERTPPPPPVASFPSALDSQ